MFMALLYGCNKSQYIEGLWVVKTVKVGNEEMTPNARWMRFNNDNTQQSGNGWYQHSIGSWNLDEKTQQLSINNTNGLLDKNEPFKIYFENENMIWERTEEGQEITVVLEKSNDLPTTNGDKIMGLWRLEESTGNGVFFEKFNKNPESLFLRWDKKFVLKSDYESIHGVYNVHGHKPEVEFIPYGESFERSFWKFNVDKDQITFTLLNSDSLVQGKFVRIHEFPE